MHFFNATHTSINVVPTTPSPSSTKSTATKPGPPLTPLAPTTPTRFDILGDLPRSTGRSRPVLRNFCKHAMREALRRTSRKRSRDMSQTSSGRKRGRAEEASEAYSTTTGSDQSFAVAAAAVALDGSEVQATCSTSGATHAESLAADVPSAEMTHASMYRHPVLHPEFAQASHPDPKTSPWLEIDIQLSCPALHKVYYKQMLQYCCVVVPHCLCACTS